MPRVDQLPLDLAPLIRRQAFEILHSTFDVDVQRLSKHLKNYVGLRGTLRTLVAKFLTNKPLMLRVQPTAIEPLIKQHKEVINVSGPPVERFFLDRIVPVVNGSVTATQLYEEYCSWCESLNLQPAPLPEFGRGFSDLGVRKERIAGRVRYIGIGIANN